MAIGNLWLGNSWSEIKDDASFLEKVTCNLFLGRNVMDVDVDVDAVTHF